MSRNYDNWEKLVRAVLRREKDRQLAYCESFSSLDSADVSLRPSSASDVLADPSARGIFSSHNIMAIPFEEIRLATQNFQPDVLLGEGKFGPVFKGWIHEHFLTAVKPGFGIAVAVRKLSEREVYYFKQPRHPNLVKLIGYGFEEGSSALVYKFLPNGSLDNHLFTRGPQLLSWETRIKVAVGAARGLSFLHDLKITVTHQGVKSSSILLDDEFNPNLSDFALTRFASGSRNIVTNDYTAPEFTTKDIDIKMDGAGSSKWSVIGPDKSETHLLFGGLQDFNPELSDFGHAIDGPTGEMTYGVGTYGYAAPKYVATVTAGRLTTRNDVYGFGVILLELLSGLRVKDMTWPKGKHHLMDWAIPYLGSKRKLSRIIDSRLEGEYPPKEAYKVAQISLQCISSEPRLRPTMVEVVAALDKL